ncbi:MAG: 2-hydroxychromene-2-carboxylate isomerase [Litoreibacter sp.]|uniref:2-hydroxychromene-2-carboxylate isomerase n=1 Tax=Litoreibacter sp. TaxID=1969459 RepID=UPI003298AB78
MTQIDVYFSTLSPFTYLAGLRLEGVAAKHGATVNYKPMDIMGLFGRTGGTPPGQRHPNRQEWRLLDMERSAKKLGMPINLKPAHWPTNPAPSCYAIIAAQASGADVGELIHGFTTACWAEERDISSDEVVRDVLTAAGLDPALADKDMLGSAEQYTKNTDDAVAAGVFGAPTYITDTGARFWGQDKIEDLDLHLSGKL